MTLSAHKNTHLEQFAFNKTLLLLPLLINFNNIHLSQLTLKITI